MKLNFLLKYTHIHRVVVVVSTKTFLVYIQKPKLTVGLVVYIINDTYVNEEPGFSVRDPFVIN